MNSKMHIMQRTFIWMVIFTVGCSPSVKESSSILDLAAYEKEIAEWNKKRYDYQKSEEGWLNLAGLFWLKEGINTFGSGSENDFVFPKVKIPERAGFLVVKQGVVTLEAVPGVTFIVNGISVSQHILYHPDSSRSMVEYGSLRWFVIKRDDKFGIRLRDLEHPALDEFHGIERYPVDLKWRIEGRVEWADSSRTIEITNVLGQTIQQRSVGTLVFTVEDKEYRLDALDEGNDEFFIVFGDETNARETYGAGRYMYLPLPDENGKLIIDFNKAFNPPCAFTEFATCPLPPKQNVLPFAVPAGELNYGTH